jgi:hypothetical protein
MKYQTLFFLFCLLSSTLNSAAYQDLTNEEDNPLGPQRSEESEQALFQEAYQKAKNILQETGALTLTESKEAEDAPPLQNYKPQVLDWKKLTYLVEFFVTFEQTSQDFNKSTHHSISVCGEDLCSSAQCLSCDYEYDPDRPKAEGPCSKGFCNCMWIGPVSLATGLTTLLRGLSSFLWCGPCGVYVSFGLGTCAGAAGGAAIACAPTCIKAVRKKFKEHRLQTRLQDLTPMKEDIRYKFADVGQCSEQDQPKLISDLEFLKQDPVMKLILTFYSAGEISAKKSSSHQTEKEALISHRN